MLAGAAGRDKSEVAIDTALARGRRLRYCAAMPDDVEDRDGTGADEEHDPTEQIGPHGCEPGVDETELGPGDLGAPPHECEYRASDELQDSVYLESLATPIAADGLPDHSCDPVSGGTHPFTYDNQCCIEDAREYVELFAHELPGRGWKEILPGMWLPEQALVGNDLEEDAKGVQRMACRPGYASGAERWMLDIPVRARCAWTNEGTLRSRLCFVPTEVTSRWGMSVARAQPEGKWVPVRPQRERCEFYARQHFGNDDEPDPRVKGHNIIYRNCRHPARRSVGGASMSLRDEAIYGCDYRVPPAPECGRWMDEHDSHKLQSRPDKVRLPLFGLAGEAIKVQDEEG